MICFLSTFLFVVLSEKSASFFLYKSVTEDFRQNSNHRSFYFIILYELTCLLYFLQFRLPLNCFFNIIEYFLKPLKIFFGILWILKFLWSRMSGKFWLKQMFMSAFLVPSMVCGTAFLINFIAIYYHASRAIPFGTMVRTCILLASIFYLTFLSCFHLLSVCIYVYIALDSCILYL